VGFFKELGDLFVDVVDGAIDFVEEIFDDDDDDYDDSYDPGPSEYALLQQRQQQLQLEQQQQVKFQQARRQCLRWARAHKAKKRFIQRLESASSLSELKAEVKSIYKSFQDSKQSKIQRAEDALVANSMSTQEARRLLQVVEASIQEERRR
jgi:hypothetical protein